MGKKEKKIFFQRIWVSIRKKMILHKHQRVADLWNLMIRAYFEGEMKKYTFSPLKQFPQGKKIIWQYWGQGIDEKTLPQVVAICFASVDKYKGEYEVIRLCDDTVKDYVDLPDFIWQKRKDGQMGFTFFSDLLRLALLHTYGGVWLDATVLLTDFLPREYAEFDYFVFQRDDNEENRKNLEDSASRYWGWDSGFRVRMLNSIIFARKNSEVIGTLMDMLLNYWRVRDRASTYFFFQILYNELMCNYLPDKRCMVVSDFIPHLLQAKLLDPLMLPRTSLEEILRESGMHKMTYYKNGATERFFSFIEEFTDFARLSPPLPKKLR